MFIWLILAVFFAALESVAVTKKIRGLEFVAKPAVMVCLFLWLYFTTGLQNNLFWFGVGILFSLVGDILLMVSLERLFVFGLVAFLLAHGAYIIGFRAEMEIVNAWSLFLVIIILINVGRLIRRIVVAMRATGQVRLIAPVIVYGTVISFMLYAAMSTLYNPAWKAGASLLVSAGAFLFCASDVLLAWNRFVSPINNGRTLNIALYHLGQMGLIAGVISQFG